MILQVNLKNLKLFTITIHYHSDKGEGEVAFFSAKRWDRRNRADLIESATPCHDAQVVGPYWDSNPLRLTILAAMSEDYTTAPQYLQNLDRIKMPSHYSQLRLVPVTRKLSVTLSVLTILY